MGGHVGGRHLARRGLVPVRRVDGGGLQPGVVQVLPVAEDGGRVVGVLAHRQDVALLVDGSDHPCQRLLVAEKSVMLRYQHVDGDPVRGEHK